MRKADAIAAPYPRFGRWVTTRRSGSRARMSGVAVGGAVVDDEDVGREPADLVEDRPDVAGLVVDRDGGQPAHAGVSVGASPF